MSHKCLRSCIRASVSSNFSALCLIVCLTFGLKGDSITPKGLGRGGGLLGWTFEDEGEDEELELELEVDARILLDEWNDLILVDVNLDCLTVLLA